MPTLVIDPNGDNLIVPCREAGLAAPRRVGGIDYAGAGNERSFIRAELRNVPISFVRVVPATARAIKEKFAKGAQIECAGDVFLNADPTDIVVCSGEYADKMERGGPRRSPDLILHEVDNADTAAFEEESVAVYLSNQASPDVGGSNLAGINDSDDPFGAGTGSYEFMNAPWVIPTCPGAPNPSIACPVGFSGLEKTWITPATVADGWITGAPWVSFLSTGGTGDRWSTQAYYAKIIVVRGGADLVTWQTGWSTSNGGFAGGESKTLPAPAVVFQSLTGDRLRIELYSRTGLNQGYADDGVHQSITFGNGGAGNHYGRLGGLGGDLVLIWP